MPRYEYTFELCWKLIKKISELEGLDSPSPKKSIQNAYQLGLIDQLDLWNRFLWYRNETSHTYNKMMAEEVYQTVLLFPVEVDKLIDKINASL